MSDANVGEGILEVTADTKPAEAAIDRLGKHVNKQAEGLISFGKKGLLATGFLVAGLGAAGKAASDLNESTNAVAVTFRENSAGILELGKKAATSVGLSSAAFNGLAVQFSAFAETIAGEGGNVVGTIEQITGRAADFASVMNIDVAEAARLFQSGLAGETEPLRKFGIDLSAAAVEAYALEAGISSGTGALTEAEKVQARYGLLMEQTTKTAGDFANTSDGAANSQRIMSAELSNMAASIGTQVLPSLTSLVKGATGVVTWLGKMNDATGGAIGRFAIFGTAGVGLISVVSTISGKILQLRDRFTILGEDGSRSITKAGKAAAIAGGLIGAATVVYSLYAADKAEATRVTQEFVDALKAETEGQAGAVDALILKDLAETKALGLAKQLGISASDLVKIVKGESVPAWDALSRAQVTFGSTANQLLLRLGPLESGLAGAKKQTAEYAAAQADLAAKSAGYVGEIFVTPAEYLPKLIGGLDTAARQWVAYGEAQENDIITTERQRIATEASNAALEAAAARNDEARDAILRHVEALNDQIDTMRSAADATYAVRAATDDYADFLAGLDEAVKNTKGDQEDLNRIYREGTTTAAELADSTVRVYEEQLKASGQTLTATAKLDLWNSSMLGAAKQASGPLRQSIVDYIAAVNGIPPEKVSDISALLDTHSVEATKLALDTVSGARTVAITADEEAARLSAGRAGAAFDEAARPRFVKIGGAFLAAHYAEGTDYHPGGLAIINENGPELVELPRGAKVHTATETRSMLAERASWTANPPAPAFPEELTLIVEGQPLTARVVAHSRTAAATYSAGRRPG